MSSIFSIKLENRGCFCRKIQQTEFRCLFMVVLVVLACFVVNIRPLELPKKLSCCVGLLLMRSAPLLYQSASHSLIWRLLVLFRTSWDFFRFSRTIAFRTLFSAFSLTDSTVLSLQ